MLIKSFKNVHNLQIFLGAFSGEVFAQQGRARGPGPGAHMALAHMGPGPYGPWPIWALAHMGPGPYGPWPIWALAHMGLGFKKSDPEI